MVPDDGKGSVGADAPLEQLLSSEPLRTAGALFAVDGEGVLRGVVTVDQVRRALQSAPPTSRRARYPRLRSELPPRLHRIARCLTTS